MKDGTLNVVDTTEDAINTKAWHKKNYFNNYLYMQNFNHEILYFEKTIAMPYKDLSTVHELVSGIFQLPQTTEEWEQYKLSEEQIAFFNENGYLANVKMLDEKQIEFLQNEVEELADVHHPGHDLFYEFHSNESSDPSTILFHALGAWRITPGFHDVLWNPRFLVAASQLLGNVPVRFWHDQLFCKPPKKGGVVAWHQDYSYWTRTKPVAHLTCWCGLDDSTEREGLFAICSKKS